mmetsp:Transcript_79975/g.226272  ORF Transcript_79975/g.226272 Transcript_79975/m.226272 type:complete len:299 (-) Transcript_79975:494-1390(-)
MDAMPSAVVVPLHATSSTPRSSKLHEGTPLPPAVCRRTSTGNRVRVTSRLSFRGAPSPHEPIANGCSSGSISGTLSASAATNVYSPCGNKHSQRPSSSVLGRARCGESHDGPPVCSPSWTRSKKSATGCPRWSRSTNEQAYRRAVTKVSALAWKTAGKEMLPGLSFSMPSASVKLRWKRPGKSMTSAMPASSVWTSNTASLERWWTWKSVFCTGIKASPEAGPPSQLRASSPASLSAGFRSTVITRGSWQNRSSPERTSSMTGQECDSNFENTRAASGTARAYSRKPWRRGCTLTSNA